MKPLYVILILCSAVVFGWLILRKPSGYDTRLNQQNESHQQKIDSLNRVWADSLHRQELKALAVFQEYARKVDLLEGDRNYWKNKAKKCEQ